MINFPYPNILIIDENDKFRKALSQLFRQRGVKHSMSLGNAEEAAEVAGKNTFDLIICDYWLPGMDGLEFFRLTQDLQPDAKKILITSYNDDDIRQKAGETGILNLISKPLTKEKIGKLAEMLGISRISAEEAHIMTVQRADKIVRNHTAGASGLGLIPIPLLDMAALAGVQLNMLRELAKVFGIPFCKDKVKHLIASLSGGGIPILSAAGMVSFVKVIPIIGQTVGALIVPFMTGAATYAVGKTFTRHFASGGTLLNFDPTQMRGHYARMLREGENLV
ncbi:MAG: hypothetical protein DRI57_19100 [Deltaproteobacteria bacterium]|nr:MAG: hypothetical protein DRI57_19100 [Deltaproteobacteria bacterium]